MRKTIIKLLVIFTLLISCKKENNLELNTLNNTVWKQHYPVEGYKVYIEFYENNAKIILDGEESIHTYKYINRIIYIDDVECISYIGSGTVDMSTQFVLNWDNENGYIILYRIK